jgi:hypothetical protein
LQYRILYVQIASAGLACFAVYVSDATTAYLAVLTGIAALAWAYLARVYRASRTFRKGPPGTKRRKLYVKDGWPTGGG